VVAWEIEKAFRLGAVAKEDLLKTVKRSEGEGMHLDGTYVVNRE
jgi:hypothetical protein